MAALLFRRDSKYAAYSLGCALGYRWHIDFDAHEVYDDSLLVVAIIIFGSAAPHYVTRTVDRVVRVLTILRMLRAPGEAKMVSYVVPICHRKTTLF